MSQRPRLVVGTDGADATIVISRRARQQALEMPSSATAVSDDRTIVRSPAIGLKPLRPTMSSSVPPSGGELYSNGIVRPAPRTPASSLQTSWAAQVSTRVTIMAAGAALLVALPMGLLYRHSTKIEAISRATTLLNWLAASADNSDSRGGVMTMGDSVAHEPGVILALVVRRDGRVLFPASRSSEVLDSIPGLDIPVSELFQLRTATSDDVLHVARPVLDVRGSPVAVALIALQLSTRQDLANTLFLLGPVFIVVVAAALRVSMSIRQSISDRLGLLNDDFELAISGQVDCVEDPIGVPALKSLTNTINYLVARIRHQSRDRA